MRDHQITTLRSEIARLAPAVEIAYVGPIQSHDYPEGVVRDKWGGYLWSYYCKLHGIERSSLPEPPTAQLSLF